MKKLIMTLAVFLKIISYLSAQQYTVVLESGSEHYIIDNNVNIRDTPSLSGKRIDQLNAGKKVVIMEMTDNWINPERDIYSPWYKIKYDNKVGFVCGLYITHKEICDDFDDDGSDEIFGCVTVSRNKNNPLAMYMVSFDNWDIGHAMIKNGVPQRIILSENPEKYLSSNSGYEPKVLRVSTGRIPFIVVKQGFGDGGGGWNTEDYYYSAGNEWEKAFTLTNQYYECDFIKQEEVTSSDRIYVKSVEKKWNSETGDYEVSGKSTRIYVWDGKTITRE